MCYTLSITDITANIYELKDLVLLETYIKELHEKLYITEIKKLAFNFPHVRILGNHHCGKEYHEAFKHQGRFYNVLYFNGYKERVLFSFTHIIQL